MTLAKRKQLHRKFFDALGPSGRTLRDVFDGLPTVAFYMKDLDCRIMAINRRNREICNIRDEWDAIGRKSDELFAQSYADDYMALDKEVLRTGKPVLGHVSRYPADRSMSVTVSNAYPLRDTSGRLIGTARAYYLAPDTEDASQRYGKISSVASYIEKHFAERISVPQMAGMTGLSETVFKQHFARTFGMPPGKYLTTIRLNAARKLLESTDKLISDIAAETGFFDQSHFTRIFRNERGLTPGDYRRRHGKA